MIERRDFMKTLSTVPLAIWAPSLFAATADSAFKSTPNWDRILVLIELKGGNDGLNTVIPYADPLYKEVRPNLAFDRDAVLRLDEKLGLHPALAGIHQSWRNEEMAIALGCGYENPNRSHFRSIDIWHTAANSDEYMGEGWLARMFHENPSPDENVADGIVIGRGDAGPLRGRGIRSLIMQDAKEFIERAQDTRESTGKGPTEALAHIMGVENDLTKAVEMLRERMKNPPDHPVAFGNDDFGRQMKLVADMVVSKIPFAAIKVAQGGFDTHSGQATRHQQLLSQLNDGISAFRSSMKVAGLWDKVLVMTYSEFGRRVRENGSMGTDHGTSAPHFILGGKVKGGFFGHQPSLKELRKDGDMHHALDYRCLYETVSRRWWNLGFDFARGGKNIQPLDCIKA